MATAADAVLEALMLWKKGDRSFEIGDFQDSVFSYKRAIAISKSLPDGEQFDRGGFEASCNAGLSGALGRLGRHEESLSAANAALSFFDRLGGLYVTEKGKWIMAIVNRGAALAVLGRPDDALEEFLRVKRMISDWDLEHEIGREWMTMLDQNISMAEAMVRVGEANPRPWWRFW